ncbi:MAG TPA: peptidase domain-containing ABC transporter [Stellaceae bacterium]|nr:peptidase domain-containing ABC transporter [Stellaceae bacterium]
MTLALNGPATDEQFGDLGGANGSLLGSLVIVARHRGVHLSKDQLVRDHLISAGDASVEQTLGIARKSGLRASRTRLQWGDLFKMGPALPAILVLRNGAAMVLLRTEGKYPGWPPFVLLRDPNASEETVLRIDEARLEAAWDGEVILVKRDYLLRDEDRPFGIGWIAGQMLRDKRIARDLSICAVVMGVLALTPVLFWRVMIDRVLYYGSLSTFTMLCIAFAVLLGFETAFGHLRRYLVYFVTARVDAKCWSLMFNKILNLPIDFFERTPTGVIVHDLYEFYRVRTFLTGQLFGTLLDSFVLVIFLPIMFVFSSIMTACVLALCVFVCLWLAAMLPVIRRKVTRSVLAETERGTHLVEAVHGIRAIKSLALDARQRHQWDVLVAKAVEARFDEGCTTNLLQTVIHPPQMMMQFGVVAVAVYLSLSSHDSLYVGAIFAFIIMAQRVAQPVIQAAQSIVQIDEARNAIKLIGSIVNAPPEAGRSGHGVRSPFSGRIEFNEVTFRYPGTASPALDRVSFAIPEGTIFGIVGRSGSGKTTVTRLLHALHSEYQGLIKIDGNDIREIDLDHLRSNLGVVLQENFLFRGTIRETIAAAKPDASFEEVVHAARLAGAEEFIERLPGGYETFIQEGSTNLSGGQRQRLAIARALMGNPRILMLDEATSALDADSEAIVNANLMRIAQGRTLIIISHRLSALVAANQILVLERGSVYDIGTHDELLERCDVYAGLWHLQHRHLHNRPVPHEIIPLRQNAAQ